MSALDRRDRSISLAGGRRAEFLWNGLNSRGILEFSRGIFSFSCNGCKGQVGQVVPRCLEGSSLRGAIRIE